MREANEKWAAWVSVIVARVFDGNSSALAAALDVAPSTVGRWIDGATPSIEALRQISEALSVPMIELLHHAGALDDDTNVVPMQPVALDTETVIRHDPALNQRGREHLLNQYEILREWSDRGDSKKTRPERAAARKRTSRGNDK